MILTTADADLYFDLMWSLQYYVNQSFEILTDVDTVEDYISRPLEEKSKVRDKLFKNLDIIDQFIADNPDHHSEASLAIIKSWQKAKIGTFFIERFLKKYSIFIEQETDKVYAVLGLYEPISDIIPKQHLPRMVKTILLPFQDKIGDRPPHRFRRTPKAPPQGRNQSPQDRKDDRSRRVLLIDCCQ